MSVRKGLFRIVTALSMGVWAMGVSYAEGIDILRSVPLEVQGYASGQAFPTSFSSADQVMQVLNSTPVFLVHMEALRRGYHELPVEEQEKLLTALLKRHQAKENDLALGFDHGYAQLVYKRNKTGLFFLRKANDKFQTQFSSLAYGMAEAEADILLESATPEGMTTRKMDAIYKLGDAVKLDAMQHQPGFWPSFIRVVEQLKPLPAYQSFSRRDFSLSYVPYGNTVVPLKSGNTTTLNLSNQPASLLNNALGSPSGCSPQANAALEADASNAPPTPGGAKSADMGNLLAQRVVNFNGTPMTIQFFPTGQSHVYQARVLGSTGNAVLSFQTATMPSVVEDLDGDGIYEIVARQYFQNVMRPVIVYRYTPCGFELDQAVQGAFQ